MEINPKEDSILDLDLSYNFNEEEGQRYRPKIVKVVRSSNFKMPEGLGV